MLLCRKREIIYEKENEEWLVHYAIHVVCLLLYAMFFNPEMLKQSAVNRTQSTWL